MCLHSLACDAVTCWAALPAFVAVLPLSEFDHDLMTQAAPLPPQSTSDTRCNLQQFPHTLVMASTI